jgi:predicted glycosyltransferase
VQYLLPVADAWQQAGGEVVVTARDYGIAFELLERRGVPYIPVGARYGAATWRKVAGAVGRAAALVRALRRAGRPHALLCAGRASLLAARALRIPAFDLRDYEHADLTFDRLAASYVLFPDVIDRAEFRRRGIRDDRLIPFHGLKEDLSFAGLDPDAVEPYETSADSGLVRVLFRPPAEESHYYREASGDLARELLAYLAERSDAVVVFSPRQQRQVGVLAELAWRNDPVVLREAVPFVSLLKGVDLVVSSGGTMVREAAYLGVPAYSIFQSEVGGVDRHLASLGRLHLVGSVEEFARVRLEKAPALDVLRSNPRLLEELTAAVLARL